MVCSVPLAGGCDKTGDRQHIHLFLWMCSFVTLFSADYNQYFLTLVVKRRM